MKNLFTASTAAAFVLAIAVPAFAGGSHCSGDMSSASAAGYSCSGKSAASAAWAGAWMQRSASGQVTITEVAKGSPASKSGLKSGDVVLAVNGYDLSDAKEHAMCASKADCKVGNTVSYRIQRGSSTKTVKVKLEKMPTDVTERFASRNATFEPALAAAVVTQVN